MDQQTAPITTHDKPYWIIALGITRSELKINEICKEEKFKEITSSYVNYLFSFLEENLDRF